MIKSTPRHDYITGGEKEWLDIVEQCIELLDKIMSVLSWVIVVTCMSTSLFIFVSQLSCNIQRIICK